MRYHRSSAAGTVASALAFIALAYWLLGGAEGVRRAWELFGP